MVRKPQSLFPAGPCSAPPLPLSCRKDKLLRFSPSLEGEWPSDTRGGAWGGGVPRQGNTR